MPGKRQERPGWYSQIGVDKQTFTKLKKLREKLARSMGLRKLSWNDFMSRALPWIEVGIDKEVSES